MAVQNPWRQDDLWIESDVKIDDDILKQELGANSDTKLKNIVRTIQKEQNAIIRNTKDKILAIQRSSRQW